MALPAPIGVQKEVVALPARGHVVVLGTAGSGKTTMAIHRAAFVSNPNVPGGAATLLLTFNKSLLRYLRHLVPEEIATRMTVENYHAFARGYLHSRDLMGGWGTIVRDDATRTKYIAEAATATFEKNPANPLRDQTDDFLASEIAWFTQHGLGNRTVYRAAAQVGSHETRLTDEPTKEAAIVAAV